jgi:hypothetical protein
MEHEGLLPWLKQPATSPCPGYISQLPLPTLVTTASYLSLPWLQQPATSPYLGYISQLPLPTLVTSASYLSLPWLQQPTTSPYLGYNSQLPLPILVTTASYLSLSWLQQPATSPYLGYISQLPLPILSRINQFHVFYPKYWWLILILSCHLLCPVAQELYPKDKDFCIFFVECRRSPTNIIWHNFSFICKSSVAQNGAKILYRLQIIL